MQKVTEISIIGEGKQLKDYLAKNYPDINVSASLGFSDQSTHKYLSSRKLTSKHFINQIENLLSKKISDLVIPVENQIKQYILKIKPHIHKYNNPADGKILNELNNLAIEFLVEYYQLITLGNLAIFKYHMNLDYEWKDLIALILEKCKGQYNDLYVYYQTQLAFMVSDPKKALDILNETQPILREGNIPNSVIYSFYYFYGQSYSTTGKFKLARDKFLNSLKHAEGPDRKSKSLLNIALSYKSEEKYINALQEYHKALSIVENKDTRIAILNNIANVYISSEDLEKAHKYVNEAIDEFSDETDYNRVIRVCNTLLMIDMDQWSFVSSRLLSMLLNGHKIADGLTEYLETINLIFDYLMHKRRYNDVRKLLNNLINSCSIAEGKARVNDEIKILAIDIIVKLKKKGEFEIEKNS